jgi:putative membrane protein
MSDTTPVAPTSNELAAQRTDMAVGRTIMALERTLMAWLRTALSLISFGFTLYKILEPLVDKGTVTMAPHAPRNLGLFLIFLGMALLLVGIFEYTSAKKRMLAGTAKKLPFSFTLVASIGILLVGLFTILNIFFGLGGF